MGSGYIKLIRQRTIYVEFSNQQFCKRFKAIFWLWTILKNSLYLSTLTHHGCWWWFELFCLYTFIIILMDSNISRKQTEAAYVCVSYVFCCSYNSCFRKHLELLLFCRVLIRWFNFVEPNICCCSAAPRDWMYETKCFISMIECICAVTLYAQNVVSTSITRLDNIVSTLKWRCVHTGDSLEFTWNWRFVN